MGFFLGDFTASRPDTCVIINRKTVNPMQGPQ